MEQKNALTLKATDGREITFDTSKDSCLRFGFLSGETAIHPNKDFIVRIAGVAPGNDGQLRLWYVITNHPRIMGRVCYWGGEKDLLKSGFILSPLTVTHIYIPDIPNDRNKVELLFFFTKRGESFFLGTDNNNPISSPYMRMWVKTGSLKQFKNPIILDRGKSLFVGGGIDPVVYERTFIEEKKLFTPIGKYNELIL